MKTVKFITLGCKVNQYDTQSMRESFAASGFKEINNGRKAGVYVINTCTVTSNADHKSRSFIYQCHRQNPKARIIVTGCYAELDSDYISGIPGVTHIIRNRDRGRISEILNEDNRPGLAAARGISSFSGHTRAFLKIQDGCNNFCSYCRVPLARGASRSRAFDDIVREARRLVKSGFKEIVLCGICLGSYGKDLRSRKNVVDVVSALEKIDGLLRIRMSSIEAGDISEGLIDKMAGSGKLCRHLHIPVQSGDDEILKKMNRKYLSHDYLSLITKIKEKIPGVAITTDVLVGFPTETEDNFRNTVALIEEIMPMRMHIFPYSKRSGTAAAGLKGEVNPPVIKERIRQLTAVSKKCALAYQTQFLNKDKAILIEGQSRCNKYWEGYTDNYIKAHVRSARNLKNHLLMARLRRIKKGYVEADLVDTSTQYLA